MRDAATQIDEVLTATDMDFACEVPFLNGTLAYYTHRCPEKPTVNEDSVGFFSVSDHQGALVVADGCGGMQSGEVASAIVINSIDSSLKSWDHEGSLRSAILDGLEAANEALLKLGTGAATTVLVAVFDEDKVRSIHAGDSQLMLIGGRGKLKLQTVSHSPVGYALEAGLIDGDQALDHEDRHLVSNIVGCKTTHLEIGSPRSMAARDTLLLATDGLFDNLLDQEIIDLSRLKSPCQAVENLVNAARQRMLTPSEDLPCKPDDIGVLLFRP